VSGPTVSVEVVTFGETMGLLAADDLGPLRNGHRMVLGIAGAESNVAIGVRRLGHSVAWAGRVGTDPIGRLVLRELRAEGVDVAHAVDDDGAPTGIMLKVHRTTATSEIIYSRRGSAGSRLRVADLAPELIAQARILHVTGITPALSESAFEAVNAAIDIANAHNVSVSLDVNHRRALWSDTDAGKALRELAPRCQFLFASEYEAALLVGERTPDDAARALAALGPGHAVVKRGELGYTACIDGVMHSDVAFSVPVVDPVGAGDAFVAGYLASWLDGADAADALRTANLTGAFVVAVPGDWEGLPTRAELAAFVDRTDAVTR
jgi:2-dehydro-3-deoxygluconokinase